MMTPFGPLPPPTAEPERTETAPDPREDTGAPAAVTSDPNAPVLRSISPSASGQTPQLADDPSIITDPRPWSPTDAGAEVAEGASDGGWWPILDEAPRESLLPGMLLAFGVLLALLMMMRLMRRKQHTRPVDGTPDERIAAIHERATASIGPLDRAMADAEQLARRLAATMENKAARLELLIEEADRKLEELNRAVAQARPAPAPAERSARPPRIDPALLDMARVEQDREERHGHRENPRLADETPERPRQEPPADPVHRRVWALADDGLPPLDIARSLNQPIGQVELILNLRRSG